MDGIGLTERDNHQSLARRLFLRFLHPSPRQPDKVLRPLDQPLPILGIQPFVEIDFRVPRFEVHVRDVLAVAAVEGERSGGDEGGVAVFAGCVPGRLILSVSKRRVLSRGEIGVRTWSERERSSGTHDRTKCRGGTRT